MIKKSDYIKSKIQKELKRLKYLIFNNNKIEFIETDETELGYFEYDKCFKVSNNIKKTNIDALKK